MSDLLSKVLPLALGSAISPAILALALLILSGKESTRARCIAYTACAALALIGLGVLALLFARTVARGSGGGHSAPAAIVDIAIGCFPLALSIVIARRPPSQHE